VFPNPPVARAYTATFQAHNLAVTEPAVSAAFRPAFKEVDKEYPIYGRDIDMKIEDWWGRVIAKTLVGSGVKQADVDVALPSVVDELMKRFSSKEGYEVFPDVLPCLKGLQSMGIRMGIVSNADSRMRDVLADHQISQFFDPIVLNAEEGYSKLDKRLWQTAILAATEISSTDEVLHVGDELNTDYYGAKQAGLHALWLCRTRQGTDRGTPTFTEAPTAPQDIEIVSNLTEVVDWVRRRNQKTENES
jgi:REG-2-like HAD superfamily hydrolase